MMSIKKVICSVFVIFFCCCVSSKEKSLKYITYNCENLFDYEHDEGKEDIEYTPEGNFKWTKGKYRVKLNSIARAIAEAGEWDVPFLIALQEIENKRVLSDLTDKTILSKFGYKFIHHEGNDVRGVDPALLYDPNIVTIIDTQFIDIRLEPRPTREVLYAKLSIYNKDTLHVFVVHLPSRLGGKEQTEPNRLAVTKRIRQSIDSIMNSVPLSNVIIMGDFNASAKDICITEGLKTRPISESGAKTDTFMYNLMERYSDATFASHKYNGKWECLDNVIVSCSLMKGSNGLRTKPESVSVCTSQLLLEPDGVDVKPMRTRKYNMIPIGYSDHLPVIGVIEIVRH